MTIVSILALRPHPLSSIPFDDDLSIVFELEDPFRMSAERIQELAIACSSDYPLASAYLYGLLEQRQLDSLRITSSVMRVGELVAASTDASQ
jgi:hypothetical protein